MNIESRLVLRVMLTVSLPVTEESPDGDILDPAPEPAAAVRMSAGDLRLLLDGSWFHFFVYSCNL